MQRDGDGLRLSATDIANHLACRHLTQLDRAVAEGKRAAPAWRDPSLELLRERGFRHERAYIEHLEAKGVDVVRETAEPGMGSLERTVEAMRAGAGAVVQAQLGSGRWAGRADLLLRVEEPSGLGAWSYEVVDTKLSQETRAGTVLQLCLYTDLVGEIQGRAPRNMHVVKPGNDYEPETFRYDDYSAYYRLVKRRLETVVEAPPDFSTYPAPVEHCDICRWWKECDTQRHDDDHLCLVAGMRAQQIAELQGQGITTLTQYAREAAPYRARPARGSTETYTRAHGQAVIQLGGRMAGKVLHQLLPVEPGRGLVQLPPPDPGDVYFDIESDPFAGDGGLEYLLGVALATPIGAPATPVGAPATPVGALEYRPWWAFDRAGERKALLSFMDLVMERWQNHPGMHVYHYSPYEPAAVKRMIGRHGTFETELDQLLRAERFVDLMAVTRQGLRISIESYSLKSVEKAFGFQRVAELRAAGGALRRIARALELEPATAAEAVRPEDRAEVESYNRDDCLSTAALQAWLEERRQEAEARGQALERPEAKSGDASEAVAEKASETEQAFELLTRGLPEDRAAWGRAEQARWLLAHLLDYFRREEKCAWWDYFRIHELDDQELMDERKAVTGLRFVGAAGTSGRSPVHRYTFPPQEAAFREGDDLHEVGGESIGKVYALDRLQCTLDIVKKGSAVATHPAAVMVKEIVPSGAVATALLAFGRTVAENGVDGPGPFRACRDLLLRYRPRLGKPVLGGLRSPGEDVVDAAVRLAQGLRGGILPIQGPPGTGKTFTGARMIAALAAAGKRIGVTAVSHKVITHLLEGAVAAAAENGQALGAVHKVTKLSASVPQGIEEVTDNGKARAALDRGRLVGGTCWLWAREEMIESVDYLFIDEAGQLSLAFALAAGRCATNIVLLGDPQQLEQPQRGAHPEGADVAALVHVLAGRKTLPDEAGLFLDETWRLHPRIARFTSEVYYEGRLRSRPEMERQALVGETRFAGSGLFFVPVEHEGNQASSPEELEVIAGIVRELLSPPVQWTDAAGSQRPLQGSDILIVAPYNAQVVALTERLPEVRVGTVDRFQGQEAPVVIYSMTSSSAADAPHGMAFIFDPNRLNVATSRARCVSIVVATRRLLEPECGAPDQMRWANGLCRYRELAREVVL